MAMQVEITRKQKKSLVSKIRNLVRDGKIWAERLENLAADLEQLGEDFTGRTLVTTGPLGRVDKLFTTIECRVWWSKMQAIRKILDMDFEEDVTA